MNIAVLHLRIENYRITGKFGEYYIWRMSHVNVIGGFNLASQACSTDVAVHRKTNLAINGQICQIA